MLHSPLPPPDPPILSAKGSIYIRSLRIVRYATPISLLLGLYYLLYQHGIRWLLELWSHNDYSHGYLIPFISLYIVWQHRERYQLLPVAPSYLLSFPIITFCLLLILTAKAAAFIQLEIASLFIIIPGILLLIFGVRITKALLVPWLYLSFSLPWFDLFINQVQPFFQKTSAFLGTYLLRLFYPVFLDNIFIYLPSISMEVAKACSGVNFLISVLALGTALVYLTQRSRLRAFFVLTSGVVIIMLTNALRIAVAGILGENFGPDLLHGPSHILQGWLVAWLGWAGLFLVNWLFLKKSNPNRLVLSERWKSSLTSRAHSQTWSNIPLKNIFLSIIIFALSIVTTNFFSPQPSYLSTPLSSLPMMFNNWQGKDSTWLEKKYHYEEAYQQIERIYFNNSTGEIIYLYIAYFESQNERRRLVKQLSQPLFANSKTIKLDADDRSASHSLVNRTTITQNLKDLDLYFWYQFPEDIIATNLNQARLETLRNGLIHRHNNGTIILIATRHNEHTIIKSVRYSTRSISSFILDIQKSISDLYY